MNEQNRIAKLVEVWMFHKFQLHSMELCFPKPPHEALCTFVHRGPYVYPVYMSLSGCHLPSELTVFEESLN